MGKMKELETKLNSLAAAGDREGIAMSLHDLFAGDGGQAQQQLQESGMIEPDHEDCTDHGFVAPAGFLRGTEEEEKAGEDQGLTYADSMIRIVKGKEHGGSDEQTN